MTNKHNVYIALNWFKPIFLQIYLDYRRGRVFNEAKKRKEWICVDNAITFEEHCYVKNEEILASFDLIMQEEIVYHVTSSEESKRVLEELQILLEKNERASYIKRLLETEDYSESKGVFSFSKDFEFIAWDQKDGKTFQEAFRSMITKIQQKNKPINHPLNLADHFGLFLLLHMLPIKGFHLDIPYKSHPLPGIGKAHTHIALTDSGKGHRQTVMYPGYFESNYVHVEHIERLSRSRENYESYRVANILDFALVRACVGDITAVTAYFGRPPCEYTGKFDLLKAANLTSAATTALFALGAAEIKLSIEPLTIRQGMSYLSHLMTFRSHPRQMLSLAFNLNREWVDDRIPDQIKLVKSRLEIGMLGIDVVSSVGWDKITWDGASDQVPSPCIMNQLTFEEALTLVHTAHERGLTTYFSGGITYGKGLIAAAVNTGVDGIGIGSALHLFDRKGHEGPFLPENIEKLNQERDEAESTLRGRAARLLSCLDRLYFEGSLLVELDSLRLELFQEIKKINEEALARILQKSESLDLPLGKDYEEWDYELLVCKRIVTSGARGIAYNHGIKKNNKKEEKALKELQTRINEANNIEKDERRIYYRDALRNYNDQTEWPTKTSFSSKFYVFT